MVVAIAVIEVFSVFSFNSPFGGEMFSVRNDFESGDLGFDPLRLKPESAEEFKEMQTKELNNGRAHAPLVPHTPPQIASSPSLLSLLTCCATLAAVLASGLAMIAIAGHSPVLKLHPSSLRPHAPAPTSVSH